MYFFEGEGGIEEWRFESAEAQSNITDLPSEIDFALTEDQRSKHKLWNSLRLILPNNLKTDFTFFDVKKKIL